MDYGKLIGDSFAYAKDGLLGNIGTWVMLLILILLPAIPVIGWVIVMIFTVKASTGLTLLASPNLVFLAVSFGIALLLAVILSAFYTGYTLKILRGETPLPAVTGFGTLFLDGIKYLVIEAIYMIPAIIILCLTVFPVIFTMMTTAMAGEKMTPSFGLILGMIGGLLLTIVVAFILGLFALIGVVRFARTGVFGEAFNFSAILETIRKITWGTYIIALLIMVVIVSLVSIVLGIIPIVGAILQFVLNPFIGVFTMRYICLLYDSAGSA